MRTLYDDGGDGGGGTGDGGSAEAAAAAAAAKAAGGELPDGAFKLDAWRTSLPEDIRENAALLKYDNLEQGARAFIGAQSLMGKSPDQIMDRPASGDAEGRRSAVTTLGALPAEIADFKLEPLKGENIPEWLGTEKPLSVGFHAKAHELGLFPDQAQAVYGWFAKTMIETEAQQEAEKAVTADTNARALEGKWGLDGFDQKLAAANFAIDKLGGEELRQAIDMANLGTNPLLLDAFQKVGFMLAEDSSGGGGEVNFGAGGDVSGGLRAEANTLIAISIDQKKNTTERREAAEQAQIKLAQADKLDKGRQKTV